MDPIDIESTLKNNEEVLPEAPLQSIHYKDIGLTYKFIDSAGETWFHQIVGEWMLGVRTRQFDYYCKNMVPPVVKRREQTSRYSYNFVKESDIHRIAQAKGKVLRMPLQDIPTTDTNEKIFSKTDVEAGYKKAVNELALAEFKNYDLRIHDLETKNDHLNTEVNRLTIEKAEIIETKSKEINQLVVEKSNVLDKKRLWANLTITLGAVLVIGGGVAALFVYDTNKDNDRLYAEKRQATTIITSLNAENSNLNIKTKMQDDEIEILKKQVPVLQNAEINAVKKD